MDEQIVHIFDVLCEKSHGFPREFRGMETVWPLPNNAAHIERFLTPQQLGCSVL
jgi:hypothetical protein